MASICSAYFFSTSLRLSFIVGVSSSSSARQLRLQQVELLDLLDAGELLVHACRSRAWIRSCTSCGRGQAGVVAERDVVVLRELLDVLLVDHDEHHQVRPLVADHHRVGDVGRELQVVLQLAGRDVLAAGRDDDVLHPVGDVEVAVVVDEADVAGVQPAVGVDRLGRLLGLVQVAHEDVRPAHQDLAGAFGRCAPRCTAPAGRCCPGCMPSRGMSVRGAAGFGHAPDLAHRHAQRQVPADQVGRDRRRAGDEADATRCMPIMRLRTLFSTSQRASW